MTKAKKFQRRSQVVHINRWLLVEGTTTNCSAQNNTGGHGVALLLNAETKAALLDVKDECYADLHEAVDKTSVSDIVVVAGD